MRFFYSCNKIYSVYREHLTFDEKEELIKEIRESIAAYEDVLLNLSKEDQGYSNALINYNSSMLDCIKIENSVPCAPAGAVEVTGCADEILNYSGTLIPSLDENGALYWSEKETTTDEKKALYKSYYTSVWFEKLEELDYDGIDTVTMWSTQLDSEYSEEATALLNWYKDIISTNYSVINSVLEGVRYNSEWSDIQPTKEEYLSSLPSWSDYSLDSE